jgi:Protein of unknown function (DUF1203)
MNTSFQITGLPLRNFSSLFSLDEADLAKRGARRLIVDKKPGFPCRVSLEDAEPGERVILLPFVHHNTESPYQSSGPIFVRQSASEVALAPNQIPNVVASRLISVRAYDRHGMMVDCDVTEGSLITETIRRMFGNDQVRYLHLHNARAGCYSCRVDRA